MSERREQRNERLEKGVAALVEFESAYAAAEHGDTYHSPAEGYMVVREEVMETTDELHTIGMQLDVIDKGVLWHGNVQGIGEAAKSLSEHATKMAIEAIHVAAAAAKLTHSVDVAPNRYFENREEK